MSDEKEITEQSEDPELNELLDSALKDFDKPVKPPSAPKKDEGLTSSTTVTEVPEEDVTVEEVWTEDFIKQTADQFKRNLEDLMQNDSNTEMGESFKRVAQTIAGAISESTGEDGSIPDFQSAINQALKDLSATSENLQNVPNITESDLAAMFGQTSLEDGGAEIFPFIQGVMQSLLSKDVLYPSLKDLVDKYPAWLTEKRATLPPTDLANYEKQLDIVKKVCTEMESETENDSEEVKKTRFRHVLGLLQEMQTCGPPPEELVSDQQPFFQLDPESNPLSPPSLPGMDDSQNCCVM